MTEPQIIIFSMIGIACAAIAVGDLIGTLRQSSRWSVRRGKDNGPHRFDREPRYETRGPNGKMCSWTDDQIFAAEKEHARLTKLDGRAR
jgi:hypothetical protein